MINFIKKQVYRDEYILENCKGKEVLNIGCLSADKKAKLHKEIGRVARYVLGIDIFKSDLENCTKANAQNFELSRKFDIVVVGEVIEHLWNLEGMFKSVEKVLRKNGKLIITTPNAYAPIFLKNAIFGKVVPNDPNHVLLFDITTLQNLCKNFLNGKFRGNIFYYEEREANSFTYKIQSLLAKLNVGYSRGIILELIKER